jgi:ribulose 1,5-bisphosphate synthetase/thiazole synthase
VRSSDYNAVRVRYVAGYSPVGSPVDDDALRAGVPEVVKQWMKIQLAGYHMNPSDIITGTISSRLDRTFHDALLDSIVVRLF